MKCQECSYYGLYLMVKDGKPFQYYGDMPCIRCKEFNPGNSEFTPATGSISEKHFSMLNQHHNVDEVCGD